jgi:hypothetical protein
MESGIENIGGLIEKTSGLPIEKIKEGSKRLANNEKFIALNKRLVKVDQTMKDFKESALEMEKSGTDKSLIESVKNNYDKEMENIIGAIAGMILKESGVDIKKDDAISLEGMIDDVLKKEGDTEESDLSGVMTTEGFETPFKK